MDNKSPAYNVKTSIAGDFFVKQYIEKRAIEIGTYIVDKNATVRQAAKATKKYYTEVNPFPKTSLVLDMEINAFK